ncbi:hypothetical protein ACQUFH_02930 [Lactococcus lactis]|uniref:hypothetical protein n=1 Tax=Lactococcus lactis TaxID=1358 RepID=UPI003D10D368
MKFKTFELNAYKSRAGITLSFDKKDRALGIITSKLFYLDSKHPLKLKITNNQAERYHIKQEIKQTEYNMKSPEGLYPLTKVIEEKVISRDYHTANKENWQDWMRIFAYEYLYDVAFNRGIRHERQRRKNKHKAMTAFDIISSEDVTELSHELGISEDKLTYAVMEVISKRKNGGMA